MATKPKQTKLEIEQRVTIVHDLLLNGSSRAQVIQYAAEKTDWELSDRQIDTYIKRARKRFVQAAEIHREHEFGLAMLRLENLYQRNLKIQDFRVALSVLKEKHSLLGLYPAQKLSIKLTGDENVLLTQLLESLQAQDIPASELFEAMLNRVAQHETANDK